MMKQMKIPTMFKKTNQSKKINAVNLQKTKQINSVSREFFRKAIKAKVTCK